MEDKIANHFGREIAMFILKTFIISIAVVFLMANTCFKPHVVLNHQFGHSDLKIDHHTYGSPIRISK